MCSDLWPQSVISASLTLVHLPFFFFFFSPCLSFLCTQRAVICVWFSMHPGACVHDPFGYENKKERCLQQHDRQGCICVMLPRRSGADRTGVQFPLSFLSGKNLWVLGGYLKLRNSPIQQACLSLPRILSLFFPSCFPFLLFSFSCFSVDRSEEFCSGCILWLMGSLYSLD
ncbi:hypothetical protein EV356DRAFT_358498 [Viridothelium virens]|uniref:Uncharacterized protein n=1 Tax=Viridothelium virens TaxID=1048519 RepID=A0A6A6HIR8_VIRVR|nr:hypothetical protein EV356DRAFT_358498 [Viridothelium virens]